MASLPPGRYTASQLNSLQLPIPQLMYTFNNNLRSLKVPAGLKVTLYDGDSFQGESRTITGDNPCLVGFLYKTSSLVIEAGKGGWNHEGP
jgi:hypothetical protein